MSERGDSSSGGFVIVLGEQKQRVVIALKTEETVDATPIVRDDGALSCEEYVTLVYELHHVHLLELQAVGLVEYDRRRDGVTRGPRFE